MSNIYFNWKEHRWPHIRAVVCYFEPQISFLWCKWWGTAFAAQPFKRRKKVFPWACFFLDGLFLTADLMEGEPLCQFSAVVKAGAACGEGRICFRSFSSSKQAELSLQQMLHHQSAAGEEGGRKRQIIHKIYIHTYDFESSGAAAQHSLLGFGIK